MARKKRYDIVPVFCDTVVHVVNRIVRRLPLLENEPTDKPKLTRRKVKRRAEMEDRLRFLATIFPVSIYAHALMSNHFHLLLKWQPTLVDNWSDATVCDKWWRLHPIIGADDNDKDAWIAQHLDDQEWLTATRLKFQQIGQFMKEFKQPLAQKWNTQDDISGNFFNRHYDSLTVKGKYHLATAMAYVDLNGFAANMCALPEQADYHSLKMRINTAPKPLSDDNEGNIPWEPMHKILPEMKLTGYLQFVDRFARKFREGKQVLQQEVPPILQRIQANSAIPFNNLSQLSQQADALLDQALQQMGDYLTKHKERYLEGKRVRLPAIYDNIKEQNTELPTALAPPN